ncbi:MAG: tetratricopeptide repeat protein [candidate division Zixibacteria bacterium]|nr:tetratricopeptide repeat protein [candidate division Zixibacteria bacterium]
MMLYRIDYLTLIAALVFILSVLVSCGQQNQQEDTDMQKEDGNYPEIQSLLDEADSTFNSGNYDRAQSIYERVEDKAMVVNHDSYLTEARSMIARCYLITGKKEEGRPWLEKAEETASPDDPQGWSRLLGVKGRFQWQDDKKKKATETFKGMYEYCSERGMHTRAIDAAHMVAITGAPEEQIEWGLKGIKEAEEGNVTGWLAPLWNNLGWTYEDQGRYQESLQAYLKAREYHWRYGTERNKLIADWAVGHAYNKLGEHDQAAQWLRPVLAWSERINEVEFRGLTYQELGDIERANKNYRAAYDYYVQAERDLTAVNMPEWDAEGFEELKAKITEMEDKL